MTEETVTCPRCDGAVDELWFVSPDLLTKEVIAEVESGDQDLADDDGMAVCHDCIADLGGD